MTKNPLFRLQRIWCCILLRLVFTLQDRTSGGWSPGLSVKISHRTSGDLDLVVDVYGGVPLKAR